MKNTIFKGLNLLVLMGVALSLIGLGVAKAQVSSLKITDANGKEVIFYQESHALVIWAGDYQYWNKLNNIENEANDVVDALKRQGFQVKLVSNPKGQKLRDEIQAFINNHGYDQNNRLVIFFAGHGHTRKKTKGYLVPIDAPDPATNRQNEQDFLKVALDMDQVESWAKQVDAKHVLFVFDSCFSGTIFKQRSGKEKPLYVQSVMNKPVRQFLTAGDADQRVPAKSVFTPLFVRALEGAADYTKDGYVTGSELGLYLKENLSQYTKKQTPQFGTIRDPDFDQGDIVFRALNTSQFVATKLPRPTVNPSPPATSSTPQPEPSPTPITTPKAQPVSSTQLTTEEHFYRGLDQYNKKSYQDAIAAFSQAITLNPDYVEAYNRRGMVKGDSGAYQEALADFNQAIKLNPDYAEAYNGRGITKFFLGDKQGSLADFNQAIKLKPDYAEAYNRRGITNSNLGDLQEALSDYNEAIRLNFGYIDAYNGRGLVKGNLVIVQGDKI